MAELTEHEKKLLLEFRRRIADIELLDLRNHDEHLITWIRARDHNLKKAEEMFRKSDAWIKSHDMLNMVTSWKPPEEYTKKFAFVMCGCDADNAPVIFARAGAWDVRSTIEKDGKELYLKYQRYVAADVVDQIQEMIRTKDKFISQFVLVLDGSGFSFRQLSSYATLETHFQTIREYEANYPESLKACYVININKWVGTILNLIKPLLSGKTMSKIQAFDSKSEKWKSILESNVLNIDTTIFDQHTEIDENDFEIATIKPGAQLKLGFKIDGDGGQLSWKFKTDECDIGFGIFMESNEDVPKELIPICRRRSSQALQEDSFLCSNAGEYTLVFDNTYSRFRSKTLHYSICIDGDSHFVSRE